MRSPWGPQTNIFYFVCTVLVVFHIFHASCGLNNLDFSGYNKIKPYVAHFEAHYANLGAFWPFQGPMKGPWDPQIKTTKSMYVVLNVYYLF